MEIWLSKNVSGLAEDDRTRFYNCVKNWNFWEHWKDLGKTYILGKIGDWLFAQFDEQRRIALN